MKRALSTAMEAGMGCKVGILQLRYILITMSRRHTQAKFEDDNDPEDDIADLAGGPHVQDRKHALRQVGDGDAGRDSSNAAGIPGCQLVLARISALSQARAATFRSEQPEEVAPALARGRHQQSSQENAWDVTPGLRGGQELPLKSIMHGDSPVVSVMPTGGGKSMLFMLPAWAEQDGLTVVVVPLVALREDMQRRCSDLNIKCAAWDWRRPPD